LAWRRLCIDVVPAHNAHAVCAIWVRNKNTAVSEGQLAHMMYSLADSFSYNALCF
jgi:hypothetical protein